MVAPTMVSRITNVKFDLRQFVENSQQKRISQQTKDKIDRLLLEKIPLADIARVCHVSETWLQGYVNRIYKEISKQVCVSEKKKDG